MWVNQFSTYIYQKRGLFYFSKRIPKQLQHCHGKRRIVFALNTRSHAKAVKYAQVICQRLDERWLPMRLDAMGLGNVLKKDERTVLKSMKFWYQIKFRIAVFDFCAFTNICDAAEDNICCLVKVAVSLA